MEDITRTHHKELEPWIKTIQGAATGIQCIAELPLYFLSGWIIKRIGYGNCVSLGFFTFFVRFYLYSIITNPLWFLPIELSNGITFGLLHAVLVSYAKIIAPDNTVTTVVTFVGALFEGVGMYISVFFIDFFICVNDIFCKMYLVQRLYRMLGTLVIHFVTLGFSKIDVTTYYQKKVRFL